MNRIIAVFGHAQCGKSSSINYVREMLRENGESLSLNPPYTGDRCETFRYKEQIKEVIEANFKYSICKNADIVITGCRSKGAPVKVVEKYAGSCDIDIEWRRKCVEYYLSKEICTLCNKEFAQMIFDML